MILEMTRCDKANILRVDGKEFPSIEARRFRIFLDGVQQTQAVYVNDTGGFIRLLKNRDRWPTRWEALHDDSLTERKDGIVEIVKGSLYGVAQKVTPGSAIRQLAKSVPYPHDRKVRPKQAGRRA